MPSRPTAIFLFLAYWVSLTTLIKWTPGKALGAAFMGLAASWLSLVVVRYVSHFVLVEADWVESAVGSWSWLALPFRAALVVLDSRYGFCRGFKFFRYFENIKN